jgi:hypothetical protein
MISDLTEEQLVLKETLCKDLLHLLMQLGAGQCRMRGENSFKKLNQSHYSNIGY